MIIAYLIITGHRQSLHTIHIGMIDNKQGPDRLAGPKALVV